MTRYLTGLPGEEIELRTFGDAHHYGPFMLRHTPGSPTGAGRRGALARLVFSRMSHYCLARAQYPVIAIPPPALARELGHGRLARLFWHRSLTPEQILRDQGRPAA